MAHRDQTAGKKRSRRQGAFYGPGRHSEFGPELHRGRRGKKSLYASPGPEWDDPFENEPAPDSFRPITSPVALPERSMSVPLAVPVPAPPEAPRSVSAPPVLSEDDVVSTFELLERLRVEDRIVTAAAEWAPKMNTSIAALNIFPYRPKDFMKIVDDLKHEVGAVH